MAYPRFVRARMSKKARRTSGNLTLNSTSWANVDTGLDLTLDECQAGDEILYGISALWDNQAVDGKLDVVTVVSATVTNSFAEQGAAVASPGASISGWYGPSSVLMSIAGAAPSYTLVAGDLTDGSITLRLRYATVTATNKTLYASADNPLDVWAMNVGPLQS